MIVNKYKAMRVRLKQIKHFKSNANEKTGDTLTRIL